MTKKELINLVKGSLEFRDDENVLRLEDLHKFFESNVCIPKGENIHPYADVLHEWAENCKKDLPVFNENYGIFYLSIFDEYRIKPSEPVYEWQWICTVGGYATLSEFLTYDELKELYVAHESWTKIEETKRVRQ